jgi:hypothetical protein
VEASEAINSDGAERLRSGPAEAASRAPVMRVPFTLDDLALTRFGDAPSPLGESFAGLIELRRRPAPFGTGRWAARAGRAFPATARPLLQLIPASPPWPGFMDPLLPELDDALEVVRATPRSVLREEVPLSWRSAARPPSWLRALADGDPESVETVVRALRDFYQACVAPCWSQIVSRSWPPADWRRSSARCTATSHGGTTGWSDRGAPASSRWTAPA